MDDAGSLDPSDEEHSPFRPVGRDALGRSRRSRSELVMVFVAIGVVAMLAMQMYLVVRIADINDRLDRLTGDVSALQSTVDERVAAGNASAAPIPAAAAAPGDLPRFTPGGDDPALGLTLGTITGIDAAGQAVSVDPADGTKRIWLVWAHWCPYCQKELPEVVAWYPSQHFEGMELVSVTTSIDPSRGNPLEPYLEKLNPPFPVIIDRDLTAAQRLGVSAFPFWVVTDGQGTVLFRTAGLLPIEQVQQLADRLAQVS